MSKHAQIVGPGIAAGRPEILGLDAIRFFAATCVTLYHLGYKPWVGTDRTLGDALVGKPSEPWSWGATWDGWIGVQIFFVLSGVVIAYSSQGASPYRFVRSRVGRLAPGMWLASLICAGVMLIANVPVEQVAVLFAKSVTFFPLGPWLAGQFWTLGVEITFYAAILGLIFADRFRWVAGLSYVLAAISLIYWLGVTFLSVTDPVPRLTALLLLQHGGYFALGLTFWLSWREGWTWSRGLVLLAAAASAVMQINITTFWENPSDGLAGHWAAPFALWATVCGLIWLSLRYHELVGRALSRHSRSIKLAGLVTYPLYLIHWHVGGEAMVLAMRAGATPSGAVLLGYAASVAVALLIVQVLEPPVRRALVSGLDVAAAPFRSRFATAFEGRAS